MASNPPPATMVEGIAARFTRRLVQLQAVQSQLLSVRNAAVVPVVLISEPSVSAIPNAVSQGQEPQASGGAAEGSASSSAVIEFPGIPPELQPVIRQLRKAVIELGEMAIEIRERTVRMRRENDILAMGVKALLALLTLSLPEDPYAPVPLGRLQAVMERYDLRVETLPSEAEQKEAMEVYAEAAQSARDRLHRRAAAQAGISPMARETLAMFSPTAELGAVTRDAAQALEQLVDLLITSIQNIATEAATATVSQPAATAGGAGMSSVARRPYSEAAATAETRRASSAPPELRRPIS